MEFGKGKFSLTPESYPFDRAFVANQTHKRSSLFLGLPQWSIPEWKGHFYTKKCSTKNFLNEYAQRLDCVEVSSTFYADIGEPTLHSWKKSVGENFRFLPKWPRKITHEKGLHNSNEESLAFVRRMHTLGDRLGVTFLQLPPSFSSAYARPLYNFLRILPKDFPVAIEFRHRSWFQGPRLYPKLESYMVKENIGSVCTDTASRRDVFHLSFTGTNNIIRYLSDEDEDMDTNRLHLWKKWLFSNHKGANFYFILHQSDNKFAPNLISKFSPEHLTRIEQLNNLSKQQQLI